jgi:hypothetical protein
VIDVANLMMHAFMKHREYAMENGLPLYPTMKESFEALPGLQAGLDQALAMIEVLSEYPQLAPHINPGGLPDRGPQ